MEQAIRENLVMRYRENREAIHKALGSSIESVPRNEEVPSDQDRKSAKT